MRPQFKDIMSEKKELGKKKKKVLKRTGRKYTHTEEALWILTTLYFIFIHDALYFFCAFSEPSGFVHTVATVCNGRILQYLPPPPSSMVYSDDCVVNLTIVLECKRRQLGM